ncbi:MAG: helix-turn-helix domain-containing protein [Glutamicibacter ardleyensis]|uniref:helix-turn-helix domain-containing protein n=1 Tax=Glutamicibacter ardleyensis TaxID=225894 RepID=UPI003F99FF83
MNKSKNETIEQTVGAAVTALRTMRGHTQKKFSELLSEHGLNIDSSAVSRLEKGERALKLSEVMIVAEVLDVDLETLVMGILTPAQELKKARRSATIGIESAIGPVYEWLTGYLWAQEILSANPELLSQVGIAEANEYLPWVAKKLHELEWPVWGTAKGKDGVIVAETPGIKEQLMECVNAYFDTRIQVNADIDWEKDD